VRSVRAPRNVPQVEATSTPARRDEGPIDEQMEGFDDRVEVAPAIDRQPPERDQRVDDVDLELAYEADLSL
jgi:hypothetical protein